jgi:DNA-directed DNA polymerase III PolC
MSSSMKNSKQNYSPIHCRTHYSMLNGLLSPGEICQKSLSIGAGAVGISDINNFHGLIKFATAAKEMGLKALYGTAIHTKSGYIFSLLCLNSTGFARANRIISSLMDKKNPDYDPVEDLIEGGWKGLLVVSNNKKVLTRLGSIGKKDLFTGLFYGLPFADLYYWSRSVDIPALAINDAVYIEAADNLLFKVLRSIDKNTKLDRLDTIETLRKDMKFASANEMESFFSAVPEALHNSINYVLRADGFIFPDKFIFPAFNGLDDDASFKRLKSLCLRGVQKRYGVLTDKIESRLRYELNIIMDKGFSGYFQVVHDVVCKFPRTCGRGSAAASIVSYLLEITHVDPLKYDLFFERFLNPERKDPPDIDVDFPWDEREKALSYVFQKYRGSSGMVADHVTFGPRSSIREPGRVMGLDPVTLKRISRLWKSGDVGEIPDVLRGLASRLYGMPRYLGTHPGGVVITPGPITNYTSIQTSPLGWPVIAWEKDGTEDAGLVKIDFLGNRSLGVLRDSIVQVNSSNKQGKQIYWESFLPIGDNKTREQIEKGDTLGVFYIESPATRQLLKKMKNGSYKHIVLASSIIRPAANRYINEYVRRLHGGAYRPFPEPIAAVLDENYGIMVYQEDVVRVAMTVGFSITEADNLRKTLSRKDKQKKLKNFEKKFKTFAEEKNFNSEIIDILWKNILSFDGYSFSKAHSASYALVSYKLSWIKRYYPLIFYTAVINNGGGYYTRQIYLNAVRRCGFKIKGPDINLSSIEYRSAGNTMFIGLIQLKGLTQVFLDNIINKRNVCGFFKTYFDFLGRINPDNGSLRILVRSGALDSISDGLTRPQMIWVYFYRDMSADFFGLPSVPSSIKDYASPLKLLDEVRTLNLIISRHPLNIFRKRIKTVYAECGFSRLIDSREIESSERQRVAIAGSHVAEKEVRTVNNKKMSFVSFEDPYNIFETVVFPEVYRTRRDILDMGIAFLITGIVENESGAFQIQVDGLLPLFRYRSPL